jgi:hypothetical protein
LHLRIGAGTGDVAGRVELLNDVVIFENLPSYGIVHRVAWKRNADVLVSFGFGHCLQPTAQGIDIGIRFLQIALGAAKGSLVVYLAVPRIVLEGIVARCCGVGRRATGEVAIIVVNKVGDVNSF